MLRSSDTINAISGIFCQSAKEVLEASTSQEVVYSRTLQKVPVIHLRPEIGCFVMFSGDYSGLMIMNFSAESALEIYHGNMRQMGFPEDEIAHDYTSDEVVDSIGELINQIIGKARREIETKYRLTAKNTQPKAIALTTAIVLTIDAHSVDKDLCRRLSFKVNGHPFHIELSMERTEFVSLDDEDVHRNAENKHSKNDVNLDDFQQGEKKETAKPSDDVDFDALMAANRPD